MLQNVWPIITRYVSRALNGKDERLFTSEGRTTKAPSPKRTTNVITGGEEVNGVTYTTTKRTTEISVTHSKRIRLVLEGDSITFDDEDADGLFSPHNDALVISFFVHDTNVKQGLFDPGSSVNIILLRVVNEMQSIDRIIPKARTLSGFDNSIVITKGEIMLTTFAEGVVKDTNFSSCGCRHGLQRDIRKVVNSRYGCNTANFTSGYQSFIATGYSIDYGR
ncbi:uncharacterized protein [Nicotiana tomentosiformis]|uniref:uncharacterized protein n=1 Tax=Nicotiana tomentosiformis TaxID=4098 RepID=UPI00388C39E7